MARWHTPGTDSQSQFEFGMHVLTPNPNKYYIAFDNVLLNEGKATKLNSYIILRPQLKG